MEKVMVTTQNETVYLFSKDQDGKWHFLRHLREYLSIEPIRVRPGKSMKIIAQKFNGMTYTIEEDELLISSSPVKEISVDGKKLTGFEAWRGITIG